MRSLNQLIELIKKNVYEFYNSKEWKKCRREILKRDNNECKMCKPKGVYTKANTVHHIKELRQEPRLCLTHSNLISLCEECHYIIHHTKQLKWQDEKW